VLSLRLASALVLAPLALVAAWLGPPYVTLMLLLAAIGMGWEWQRLAAPDSRGVKILILAAILLPVCLMIEGAGRSAWAVALIGAGALWLAAGRTGAAPLWAALGTLWIALASLAFLSTALSSAGRAAIIWLFAIVWATDCGAYVAGRGLGGPLLAPRISPKKTWAGLAGGLIAAVAVAIAAAWFAQGSAAPLIAVGLALSFATQGGDLVESLAKRHFGVKDSGTLIPGHGGLLDRLDGMLAAALLQFLIASATGESAPPWRF
jgi:phosphatidate cytidylyltransferase